MFRIGREALLDVQEWSVGPVGCPGVVRRPYRMYGSGQQSLSNVREWSGDLHECPERPSGCPRVVERRVLREWSGGPPGCPGVVGGPYGFCGSGRETLPNGREVVGRPSGFCGSGREALSDVQEWSGGHYGFCYLRVLREWSGRPPECPGVVGRSCRMSGSGREAFPDVREWSRGPSGCPGVVWRPF